MAFEIKFSLNRLKCFAEDDGFGASEPYIWAFAMVMINGIPFIYNQPINLARVVIQDSMRPNDIANIPTSVGQFGFQLDQINDITKISNIILVISLLEEDSSKETTMRKGLEAYNIELPRQLLLNAEGLKIAIDTGNEVAKKAIIDEISKNVSSKVKSAVLSLETTLDTLSTNHDDQIATDFKSFSLIKNSAGQIFPIQTQIFNLSFIGDGNNYQIEGKLSVIQKLPHYDFCKSQADAVINAQHNVNSIKNHIKSGQQDLQQASPIDKPRIIQKIEKAELQLESAEIILADAQKALQDCRNMPQLIPHNPTIVINI